MLLPMCRVKTSSSHCKQNTILFFNKISTKCVKLISLSQKLLFVAFKVVDGKLWTSEWRRIYCHPTKRDRDFLQLSKIGSVLIFFDEGISFLKSYCSFYLKFWSKCDIQLKSRCKNWNLNELKTKIWSFTDLSRDLFFLLLIHH